MRVQYSPACSCGNDVFELAGSDGTPQPEPFFPLLNLMLICCKCGKKVVLSDCWFSAYESKEDPNVVTTEVL